ncbi:hypothetical protein [Mangrovibacterium marinum]|uniref:Uncharacterized protein n=1 Tax=Mangrovibacterium marinum TaxID=1639118 RepID=A0A2T5C2U9_9BACT|nr:hypothetical protein [Mangrovibacterium marinum]PTN09029.1 hypothetical protein C8N47_106129 [Mangrovibacterium marinum]
MSYQDDYDLWKEEIGGVPSDEIKLPNRPVDEYAASVETLAVDANQDRDALGAAGMDVTLIDELTPLAGALRYCQAVWMGEYRFRQEAQKEWGEQSPAAFELRDGLLHDFSFAYRNDADNHKRVMRIREGGSNADMVQDLYELAELGAKYPDPLTAINFDLTKLDLARATSETMAELLAAYNGTAGETSPNKVTRDKAFTLLAEKAGTVREFGQYIFWKDEEKRKKYLA